MNLAVTQLTVKYNYDFNLRYPNSISSNKLETNLINNFKHPFNVTNTSKCYIPYHSHD